jgi:multicomponent Na+:H+ antiporter subunit D
MISSLPPALILVVGAIVLPLLPRKIRPALYLLFPILAFIVLVNLDAGARLVVSVMGYDLVLLQADRLSLAFGYIFVIMTFLGGVYGFHVRDVGQQAASLLYAGSSLGVCFAGDLLTLFVFWELMMVGSSLLIWSRRTRQSGRAGMRYFVVHFVGGILLLGGIWLHADSTGSLAVGPFAGGMASYLILISFALNAAVPPLHAWLPDAYPEGTVTGSVFLSAFTTKVAVYALIRCFAGFEPLIWVGTIMAVYGVVFAILQNDIRRLLSYHIISQVGYMVAAVGIGTEMAINGATAHAFTHILYKALLFMGAGAVLHTTGRSKLSQLGGLARSMPLTLVLYMIGALSISAFPLFSGFVSKSMVVYAAGQNHLGAVVLLMYLVSIATFLSVGLKLPYFTWFGSDRSLKPSSTPAGMYISMALTAGLCVAIGIYPSLLYDVLPFTVTYRPYTMAKVVETMQLLAFTGFGFWLLVHRLEGKNHITLDTDWFYRRLPRLIYGLAYRLYALWGGPRAREFFRDLPGALRGYVVLTGNSMYQLNRNLPRAANRLARELFAVSGGRQAYERMLPQFREYSRDIALGALFIAIALAVFLIATIA